MVAWTERYYVSPFKGYRGNTQGYPMPPTILNIVVYLVIHHWEKVVGGEEEGLDKFRRVVQTLS